MTVHNGRDLTSQVIAVLEAAGLTVGRAEKPETVPANSGYVIVYPLPGGTFDGDIYDPYEEAEASYQLTSIAEHADQCEWVADLARSTMLSASLTLTGRSVIQIEPVFLGGVLREDDTAEPARFYAPDRYSIWTG